MKWHMESTQASHDDGGLYYHGQIWYSCLGLFQHQNLHNGTWCFISSDYPRMLLPFLKKENQLQYTFLYFWVYVRKRRAWRPVSLEETLHESKIQIILSRASGNINLLCPIMSVKLGGALLMFQGKYVRAESKLRLQPLGSFLMSNCFT